MSEACRSTLSPGSNASIQAPAAVVQRQSDPYHKQDYGSRFPGLESSSTLNVAKTREHANEWTETFKVPKFRRAFTFGSSIQPVGREGHQRAVSHEEVKSHSRLRAMNRIASQTGSIREAAALSPRPIAVHHDSPSWTFLSRKWTGAAVDIMQPTSIGPNGANYIAVDISNKPPMLASRYASRPLDLALVIDTS